MLVRMDDLNIKEKGEGGGVKTLAKLQEQQSIQMLCTFSLGFHYIRILSDLNL